VQFLERNWNFRKHGELYSQGYAIDPADCAVIDRMYTRKMCSTMSSSHLGWFPTNGSSACGSAAWQGQQNAGTWEAHEHARSSAQAPHESADAYYQRINAYNNKNEG
jgi:hypothetical protein